MSATTPVRKQLKRCLLIGNPNAGKTLLFNRLTGLRAKTANFPGVTIDVRSGKILSGSDTRSIVEVVDCPGIYSLDVTSRDEQATLDLLETSDPATSVVVYVCDATNVERNLMLYSQLLERGSHQMIVALNLIDAAEAQGIQIDTEAMARELGCPVVAVSARTGAGITQLLDQLNARQSDVVGSLPILMETREGLQRCLSNCTGCRYAARFDWAEQIAQNAVRFDDSIASRRRFHMPWLDRWLTDRVVGPLAMLVVMLCMFAMIFSFADLPMAMIENLFGWIASQVDVLLSFAASNRGIWITTAAILSSVVIAGACWLADIRLVGRNLWIGLIAIVLLTMLPQGDFHSLVIDGVIAGIAGVVVFLPQICILFFFISLLEDSGYLARGAFVMERFMRFVGLPGAAFVPMLSAHACAIPGIMAARTIDSWRDRLVTILVLPLLTCSARLPVYTMVAALLFAESPWWGALVFVGAYSLGIAAALGSAFVLKHTIIRGDATPLVIELPPYRLPSLRNATLTVYDRARDFLANAGSVILLISVVLWFLASYPKLPEGSYFDLASGQVVTIDQAMRDERPQNTLDTVSQSVVSTEIAGSAEVLDERLIAQSALAYSFAGRLGRAIEPVFAPLGFDWKIDVGVLSSFAAREVLVSALSIVYGLGEEGADDEQGLIETLRRQKKPDGTLVFNTATCLSLLVFYVLAMQCLPTQAVTRRETGSWKWAGFQLGFMTVLAYVASWLTYTTASVFLS